MVVPADRPGVVLGGDPAVGVVDGVIEISVPGRAAAAGMHTRPVADLDMAAQRSPGEAGSRILPAGPVRLRLSLVGTVGGVLGGDISDHRGPLSAGAARLGVGGEVGDQGGRDMQFDDPASCRCLAGRRRPSAGLAVPQGGGRRRVIPARISRPSESVMA